MPSKLRKPNLSQKDGGIFNDDYNDIYFQPGNAYAETSHVFLDGNDLYSRFLDQSDFTVAELGFGTGLNFCATAKLWKQFSSGGTLTFISCENAPLPEEEIARHLAGIPEIQAELSALLAKLPELVSGVPLFSRV